MWNYVGIVRTTKRLERAKHRIDMLRQEVARLLRAFPGDPGPHRAAQPGRGRRPDHPLSALSRHESRGLHYTLDYPEMLAQAKDTVLVPDTRIPESDRVPLASSRFRGNDE